MDTEINQSMAPKSSPKKRVLFVITQSELGGAQKFLSQLAAHLKPEHFDLAVASGPDGNKEIKATLPENVQYITARYLRRNPNVISDIASVFELKKIIKNFGPDTLFLNSSKAGFVGSLAAKLLQATRMPKIIYRIGGWTFNDPWPKWKQLAYRRLEKISAGWKDIIIVNNKHDYDQAVRYGIKPRKNLVLIHNGLDPYKLDFWESGEAKIKLYEFIAGKQGSFLREGLTVGTIANFYPTKGLEYLVDAFSSLKANLVIIGDGPQRDNLKSQISNLKLENKVFLTGKVTDAYKYLRAFDIFVLPSVKEGFPWALLEAMSAKLPVIATAIGANPEIIENEKNGILVPPADSQALVEAINKLATSEHLRRELGIQAHQTVLHKFTLRKMLDQVEALL